LTLPKGRSKSELQKVYGKKFRQFNLHHMIPSSCGGLTNEFNLFPYKTKSHSAYNYLFLNMSIWQVWERTQEIHRAIFDSGDEFINRHWLEVCCIRCENEKRRQIEKRMSVIELQEQWRKAFGGESLQQARKILKFMMLFMVFGSRMANTDHLFNNGNLIEFFEKYPANEDRLRAFNICFGESVDCSRIKTKMSKILR